MYIPIISDVIKAVSSGYSSYQDGRTKIKAAEIDAKVRIIHAKAAREERESLIERDWDMEALRASKESWKDEAIMVLWFTPFIMLFIPVMQPYAIAGFDALTDVPYGYWLVLFGIVAQAFGLRWLFQNRMDKAIKSVKGE